MGAYIYRLRGPKHFTEMPVEGKMEKVYDLVFWYKPYYSFWDEKEPSWMKGIRLFGGRLKTMFKSVEVKFVRIVDINKKTGTINYADTVMEWRPGMLSVYDEPDWERLRHIKL
jgi:hypothetical protein